MSYLGWAALVFISLLVEAKVSVLSVTPNATALVVYLAAIRGGEMRGMMAGLAVGFLQDGLVISLLGPHMLGKVLVGYLAPFLTSGKFFRWTPVLGLIGVGVVTALDSATVYFVLGIFDRLPADPGRALYVTVMHAILNAPAGLFMRPRHAD